VGEILKRVIAVVGMGLALCGCATMEGLMAEKPEVEFTTLKSPKQVLVCIKERWDSRGYPYNTKDLPKGQALGLRQNAFGNTFVVGVAVVEAEGAGSRVKYTPRDSLVAAPVFSTYGLLVEHCR
jgi:hypothetical protein